MFKIALVEDVDSERTSLRLMIERYAREHDLSFVIEEFSSAEEFLNRFHHDYDLIFEDIEMPGMDGFEAMKRIREIDEDVMVIFVTGISRLVIDSYKVRASDYIIKPFSVQEIDLALNSALRKIQSRNRMKLTIKDGDEEIILSTADIIYVEADGHTLIYHTGDETYEEWGTLSRFEKRLSAYGFMRCNKSHMINLSYVKDVSDDEITIFDQKIRI